MNAWERSRILVCATTEACVPIKAPLPRAPPQGYMYHLAMSYGLAGIKQTLGKPFALGSGGLINSATIHDRIFGACARAVSACVYLCRAPRY